MLNIRIKKFLQIFTVVLTTNINAQVIAVENTSFEYGLPTIPNYLTIVVENQGCDNIYIQTDNGTIKENDSTSVGCDYLFIPEKIGIAILKVYKIVKRDTIILGERKYQIKKWPEQRAKFSGRETGTLSRAEFWSNSRVIIPVQGVNIDTEITVKSYWIKVIRNRELILNLTNKGGHLSPFNRQELLKIISGDIVIFENIVARLPGEDHDRQMNVIKLEIE